MVFLRALFVILAILVVTGLMGLRFALRAPAAPLSAAPSPSAPQSAAPSPAAPQSAAKKDSAAASLERMPVRITTWNVRDMAANDITTGERIGLHDAVARYIRDLAIDIIAFQEIQRDDRLGGDIALLSVALAKAGWAMPWKASVDTGSEDNIAIFSRYKILESTTIMTPEPGKAWPRPGIRAAIETGAGPVYIYSVHFKAKSTPESIAMRAQHARILGDILRAGPMGKGFDPKAIVVVTGDFNTTQPEELSSQSLDSTLSRLELKDDKDTTNDFLSVNDYYLPGVPTFIDSRYRKTLDHMLLSPMARKTLVPGSVRIAALPKPEPGKPWLSDHRPIIADLALGAAP